ncbi:hypothetical protein DS901_13015 [Loktanella sp. D2R18]|uniref:hypothetical protein n=1 Tax=Rhodobacterales TaxID=204455 RepID=UPI000DE8D142|nr:MULTISPECIES: hypothetical protein [Rhodobacterales]MDO6591659.1 hypothetical protein [Yoonia sp. 1_MG-2023]RBW42494.1 hypothetical protein DS901_13015 [Loktanella sp. D2R18]
MLHKLTLTSMIALIAGAASAEDGLNYAHLSYDYSHFDIENDERSSGRVQGGAEYTFGQFLLSADIASIQHDVIFPLEYVEYAVSASYMASPEMLFGAGFTGVDGDIPAWDGYEVFGQYQNDQFAVALNYTSIDDDDALTSLYAEYAATPELRLGLDVQSYTYLDDPISKLSASYDAGPIQARGYYQDSNLWFDSALLGARGSYDVNETFRVMAAVETSLDDSFEAQTYAIGAGYQVTDGVWLDASAGQSIVETTDITHIQAMISFETGTQTRVDQRFNQLSRDDRRSSVLALFPL